LDAGASALARRPEVRTCRAANRLSGSSLASLFCPPSPFCQHWTQSANFLPLIWIAKPLGQLPDSTRGSRRTSSFAALRFRRAFGVRRHFTARSGRFFVLAASVSVAAWIAVGESFAQQGRGNVRTPVTPDSDSGRRSQARKPVVRSLAHLGDVPASRLSSFGLLSPA
jgi:hypothetical protein